MKLAVSQIAWQDNDEVKVLKMLQKLGFAGVEVAPTRVAGETPYDKLEKARFFAQRAMQQYGLAVCSMQSMWFGQTGSMFGPEREHFLQYTRKAILFARQLGAGNIVFGNPKNRVMPPEAREEDAVLFFKQLGDFAAEQGTVLALEANPAVYGTNFMNKTPEAFAMAQRVNSPGCRVNLDFGTIIINNEDIAALKSRIKEVNHVHISEPELAPPVARGQHKELAALLKEEGYSGYVSLEMRTQPFEVVQQAAEYLREVFA